MQILQCLCLKDWNNLFFVEILLALLRYKLRSVTVVYTSITLTEIFTNGKLYSLNYLSRLLALDFPLPKPTGILAAELGDHLTEALSEQLYLAFANLTAALSSCSLWRIFLSIVKFKQTDFFFFFFDREIKHDLLDLFFFFKYSSCPLYHCLQYF